MTDDQKQTLKDEVMSRMNAYIATFLSSTREDAQTFVKLPVAYITETDVQMHESYPLDPEKLRQSTGLHHLNGRVEVLHISTTKAHVLIEATREREDNSPIEQLQSLYIWQRRDGKSEWLITAFSGIRLVLD